MSRFENLYNLVMESVISEGIQGYDRFPCSDVLYYTQVVTKNFTEWTSGITGKTISKFLMNQPHNKAAAYVNGKQDPEVEKELNTYDLNPKFELYKGPRDLFENFVLNICKKYWEYRASVGNDSNNCKRFFTTLMQMDVELPNVGLYAFSIYAAMNNYIKREKEKAANPQPQKTEDHTNDAFAKNQLITVKVKITGKQFKSNNYSRMSIPMLVGVCDEYPGITFMFHASSKLYEHVEDFPNCPHGRKGVIIGRLNDEGLIANDIATFSGKVTFFNDKTSIVDVLLTKVISIDYFVDIEAEKNAELEEEHKKRAREYAKRYDRTYDKVMYLYSDEQLNECRKLAKPVVDDAAFENGEVIDAERLIERMKPFTELGKTAKGESNEAKINAIIANDFYVFSDIQQEEYEEYRNNFIETYNENYKNL